MKKEKNPVVHVWFAFTGSKDDEINESWSESYEFFNVHILPSPGDLVDFMFLFDADGVLNMIEDYNTTIFEVISRTFVPNMDEEGILSLTFTIKPCGIKNKNIK